jgi:pimeloyl-ACP methyl ester carboxylesterase
MEKLNDAGVVLFLMKNLARKEDGSLFWRMNLPVLAEKYAETTKAIEGGRTFEHPALFIRGGQSKYITDADWNEIVELFPKARLETIAKAGHWVHADAMEELLAVVRGFLTATN